MSTTPKVEKRRFGMHANLLYDVITKQAGTLQKAILEGVMNGVDAGASRIDITLDMERLTISDDGKGFVGRREIEDFFETFGTPHKEGDATYGRFRMGRGQLMAFGRNTWRTNQYRMEVDIKAKGLDYDLYGADDEIDVPTADATDGEAQRTLGFDAPATERVKGCSIEVILYDRLLPSKKDEVEREIKEWVCWVDVPVHLNGVLISEDPAKAKWTVTTDDAYFKLSSTRTTMSVYNLGVLVMRADASRYGIGGTVVSRKRLDVNFARNDVQDTCDVFKRIKSELRKHSDKETSTKRKLTEAQKTHLAHRIVACDIGWAEASQAAIFTDVDGKGFNLEGFRTKTYRTDEIIAAPRSDRTAVKVQQQGMAIAVANETLERFGVKTMAELIPLLVAYCRSRQGDPSTSWTARYFGDSLEKLKVKTLDDYRHLVDETFETLDPKKLTANRRMLLRTAEKGGYVIARELDKASRRMLPGRSEVAHAWTDGVKAIWIETDSLKLLSLGYQGCTRFASLLLHEYMHDGPDTETHEHDAEFYENFHNAVLDTDVVGKAATAMMKHMAELARREGNKPTDSVLLFEDLEVRLVRAGAQGTPATEHDGPETDDQDMQQAA
jgi:hypothetical protein